MVGFDLGPSFKVKLKSAHNLLVIDPRGLQCETNSYKISVLESPDV